MILVPGLLGAEALARVRDEIDRGAWIDGSVTAGAQSALAKRNRQLPEGSPSALAAGDIVLDALAASARFVAGALPLKLYPPLFSAYECGEAFGAHVDGAVRSPRGSDYRVRADLSATLFLSEPADYDGGALVVETANGAQSVRAGAGDMIVYPASTIHRVEPVTRGRRLAAIFWVQSMVRDDGARATLFELDEAVQALGARVGQGDPAIVRLTGVYHNLLRRWAEL